MNVAECVATTLAELGVGHAFGVVGSGNFHVTNGLRRAGVPFVAARHECGAAMMADAYARISGDVTAVTLHQGCGLTNALTGITEAAKSRTPMVVLVADVTEPRSNFYVDQDSLAEAVGAVAMRVDDPDQAAAVAAEAFRTASLQRRTVVLNLALHVQEQGVTAPRSLPGKEPAYDRAPSTEAVNALVEELRRSERPVFIAGRGARGGESGKALEDLADKVGALLATSAVAKGLFHGNPWSLDVSGGFASPLAAELIRGADLVVAWGCALNMWTTRQGTLIPPTARVAQVDLEGDALGRHRDIDVGVIGGVAEVAAAASSVFGDGTTEGYRSGEIRQRIAREIRWADVAYRDTSTPDAIDPRTFTRALDDLLPRERIIGVDSGNFMGYPSMFLSVPDQNGFCFTQAFQSIGLGLATAIGAALARPDRLPVAALGDGGALMAAAELETVARLGLPMVVAVYNDAAYGAEVHHFGPDGHDLETVRFPPTDIAAIAEGYGFASVTVRTVEDMAGVKAWIDGDRTQPLLIDAKVTSDQPSWWLEEAFRGH